MSQMSSGLKLLSSAKCFGGFVQKYEHTSNALGGLTAKFSLFLPESATKNPVPILYWLSGLTCTEDNFIQKAGAQKYANTNNIALVCPDTSPRTITSLPGEHDTFDFGSGAGFYVNATETPWNKYYNMYDYINGELPLLLRDANLPLQTNNASIFGHSMGGHGALISFLRNPRLYKSVSAFSPICNPINCRWGQKCFSNYLGDMNKNLNEWKQYDATELLGNFVPIGDSELDILIDQGTDDNFLKDGDDNHNQLLPDNFVDVSKQIENVDVHLRLQKGYGHDYYFISTFVQDHIEFHAQYLYSNVNN
eukprot:289006_1